MNTKYISNWGRRLLAWMLVIFAPLIIAFVAFKGWQWDFSVPFVYNRNDDVWQLILTKWLLDNGWILNNPFLGAPDIAHGHYNSAAQASSLHSIIMKFIGVFVVDSVKVQNFYYFLNFSLISVTSYVACRILNVSRLFSVPAGILFSLGLTRLNAPYFAFISNYFMIPLAIVIVVWCAKGEYLSDDRKDIRTALLDLRKSKKFWLSLLIAFFVAISDGYYAFFTMLLLGLSSALVFFHKPSLRVVNGLIPLFFAGIIMGTALMEMSPLTQYRNAHHEEFFPGGIQDPSLTIHPFEAEVYASTLKTMLIPNLNHRVAWLARLGKYMTESGARSRSFGYGIQSQLGSITSLGFLLLLSLFLYPRWILGNKFVNNYSGTMQSSEAGTVLYMFAVMAGFIFICETLGGLGSLIAFVYPFIRAYERLSFFLIFIVLMSIGFFLTYYCSERIKNHPLTIIVVTLVTIIFLLDQIPVNLARSMELPHVKRFLAERELVHAVEESLKPGDMVYQYPYAQYMAPSPYYGMGSQAQMRSYLHSHYLRWSNGASKNSSVDIWHRNLAKLPPVELFSEMVIYGFKGALVDRWVVKDDEFHSVSNAAISIGANVQFENSTAEMAYFKFPDYGFHLFMDKDFKMPEQMLIHKDVPLDYAKLPPYINGDALKKFISTNSDKLSAAIYLKDVPGLLDKGMYSAMRSGLDENLDKAELLGDVNCANRPITYSPNNTAEIHLDLRNNSMTTRRLNFGLRPINLGYHILSLEGKLVSWDNGYRLKENLILEPGKEQSVTIPVASLGLNGIDGTKERIVFELLQEGNAWYGVNPRNKVCSLRLPSELY